MQRDLMQYWPRIKRHMNENQTCFGRLRDQVFMTYTDELRDVECRPASVAQHTKYLDSSSADILLSKAGVAGAVYSSALPETSG
jgi:hypothetical protein